MADSASVDPAPTRDESRRARPDRENIPVSQVVQSFADMGSQVVWIGGYPRDLDAAEIETCLWQQFPDAIRIEVLGFPSPKVASKYPEGSKHRGCALVACDGVKAAQKAAVSLHTVSFRGGDALIAAPTAKIPPHWDETLYVPGNVLAERKRKAVERAERSQHRSRRRLRQATAHQASVHAALACLPPPGGAAVAAAFQPINASPGTEGEEVEVWLRGVPWAAMPEQCWPATHFKDADSERQRLRTTRKLVQVECFALVLAQILPVAGLPAGESPGGDAPGAAFHVRGGRIHAAALDSNGADARPQHAQQARRRLRAVDFGCGSGNLALPLAYAFPGLDVCGVDMKEEAIERLRERAAAAGLPAVSARVGTIEEFREPCDVVLALHACGNATDGALLQAHRHRAAFIVSPCCVGKLKFSAGLACLGPDGAAPRSTQQYQAATGKALDRDPDPDATSPQAAGISNGNGAPPAAATAAGAVESVGALELRHPRSQWMRGALQQPADFVALARAADISHVASHSAPGLAVAAKGNIEMDRAMAAAEAGFHVALVKLRSPELTTKADIIVGVPRERAGAAFRWPWLP